MVYCPKIQTMNILKTLKLLSLSILLFTLSNSVAQAQIAFQAGLNYSKFQSDAVLDMHWTMNAAPYFGISYATNPRTNVSLTPEIQYSMKGTVHESVLKKRNHYLDFALNLNVRVEDNIQLSVGGNLGVNVKEEAMWIGHSPYVNSSSFDNFHKLEYGAILGATFRANDRLNFNVRYLYGLSNVNNSVWENHMGGQAAIYNRTLQFGIAVYMNKQVYSVAPLLP